MSGIMPSHAKCPTALTCPGKLLTTLGNAPRPQWKLASPAYPWEVLHCYRLPQKAPASHGKCTSTSMGTCQPHPHWGSSLHCRASWPALPTLRKHPTAIEHQASPVHMQRGQLQCGKPWPGPPAFGKNPPAMGQPGQDCPPLGSALLNGMPQQSPGTCGKFTSTMVHTCQAHPPSGRSLCHGVNCLVLPTFRKQLSATEQGGQPPHPWQLIS